MRKLWATVPFLFGYILFVGIFFTNRLMFIKKKSDEEIIERETKDGHFNQKEFDSLKKDLISIPSRFGYDIKGYLIAPYKEKKFMIICHGVTMNHINSVKYMNLFLKRGFNVIIYDHRRHGLTTCGKTTSYGHYEKEDLKAVVDWVKNRFGKDATIGIHGESMGAVTTLLYAGMLEDGADFYIVDCPFSDFEKQLLSRLKEEYPNLSPVLVMPIAKLFLKLRDGYRIKDVSPIRIINKIQHPILFIHSETDDYIPVDMTKELYEKKKGAKQLFIAPKGLHAMSYTDNKKEYEEAIDRFLGGLAP